MPQLECVIKETLRLHAPLIILMRKVQRDFHYKHWTVPAGSTVAVSPAVSNRMPDCFPEPERFDPSRYVSPREEDKQGFAWIPFGGGRHRCVGASFAMMQLKAIFSVLLRRFEFEMAQPSESYRNDHSKMVVQLEQPCRVRYRRRVVKAAPAVRTARASESGRRRARCACASTPICVRGTACAPARRPRCSASIRNRAASSCCSSALPRRCAPASRRPCATARRARFRSRED